jgi:tRNA U34 2-thiouridine synthase MnmA/TrmU
MISNSNAIEQFNTLTPAHQQQAIDFIAFLKAREQVKAVQMPAVEVSTGEYSRLQRKQGVLVIDTGRDSEFDINAFIGEMREERIQDQIGQASP